MIEPNIQNVLTRNREKLLIMFIIKNSEGKYLVTKNPYFNCYSLPCKHFPLSEIDDNARGEELTSLIMEFLKKEFDFAGIIEKYIETIRGVANINNTLQMCNILCFELKSDDDYKEILDKQITLNPTAPYNEKDFVSLEKIGTNFWNHIIDQNSYYFALRAKDKNTVQTVNVELNIDLEI